MVVVEEMILSSQCYNSIFVGLVVDIDTAFYF